MKLPGYTLFALYGGIVACAHQKFCCLCAHLASRSLLAASISHFLTAAPLFAITRSNSFSVIHVSVDIKSNVEKGATLLLFFSFLSQAAMRFPAK